MALGENAIDASSFTVVRLLSGAVTLIVILKSAARKDSAFTKGSWLSALMLFLYAIAFLSEAITARLIFSAVMILGGILIVVLGRYYFVQLRVEAKR